MVLLNLNTIGYMFLGELTEYVVRYEDPGFVGAPLDGSSCLSE